MKNQTKAILASTMILALALSSVAGVTYSWFSDSDTGTISIGTATVEVKPTLTVVSNTTPCEIIEDVNIQINEGGRAELELCIKNKSSVPVETTAKVVMPRYTAYNYTDGTRESYAGEVFAEYDGNGNRTFKTDDSFWMSNNSGQLGKNIDAILFGDNPNSQTKMTQVSIGSLGIHNVDGKEDSYEILYYEYTYVVTQSLYIKANDHREKPFMIFIDTPIYKDIIKELYIKVDSIQVGASSIQYETFTIGEPLQNINVYDSTKSLVLKNDAENLIVTIDGDALNNITRVTLYATVNAGGLSVIINYWNGLIQVPPTTGDVHIYKNTDNGAISVTMPASCNTYSISYTNNSG